MTIEHDCLANLYSVLGIYLSYIKSIDLLKFVKKNQRIIWIVYYIKNEYNIIVSPNLQYVLSDIPSELVAIFISLKFF